jgi:Cu+-exporting ATPase
MDDSQTRSTAAHPGSDAPIPGAAAAYSMAVRGMDCASCAESVSHALRSLDGVQEVHVDVIGGRVDVRYADGNLAPADLVRAVQRSGYAVRDDAAPRRADFAVEGMCCAAEVRQIEGRLGSLAGVDHLGFDPVQKRLTVEGDITPAEVEFRKRVRSNPYREGRPLHPFAPAPVF